ncbi:CFS1-like protein [Schizophyllum amplum]|uniref:CFS1-like protein n=1 Tax=Schizophyllum amplum TaxID=97359 RepID=A0A550C407_9AGAR|nr:CFS1-like protein [Auriculariopsis ampla]
MASSTSPCVTMPATKSLQPQSRLGLLSSLPSPRALLVSLARSSILSVLSEAIKIGHLTIADASGDTQYGTFEPGCNDVHLRVVDDTFWLRLLTSADLGFSEAYMIGDIEINSLQGAMKLWLDNQSSMEATLSSTVSRISSTLSAFYNNVLGQSRSNARLNAIASYDQSNELFKAFLSKEMMYSCALWDEAEGGVRGDLVSGPTPGDLEAAQRRKIHHVLRCARVRPGDRILEFGSGWGGMAIEAAGTFGCEVDTLTLSKEQKALAEERVRAAGLEGRFEHAFDAFVSIEMIEHVGAKHYETYFKLVDFALKPQNATAIVTSSTFPECRYTGYQAEDFMRRYMWPNSALPSATVLINAANVASQGRFTLHGIPSHAPRMGPPLGEESCAGRGCEDIPDLTSPAQYEVFKRKWEYLFAYAGAGFAKGYITCHMLTFIRGNDCPEPCD